MNPCEEDWSEQVEAPESVSAFVEALARAHYESARSPHMPPYDEVEPDPRTGSDIRAGFRGQAAQYQAALPAIYKHFGDLLLSGSVIEAGSDAVAASAEYDEDRRFEAGMRAALQATSTPEVDRG